MELSWFRVKFMKLSYSSVSKSLCVLQLVQSELLRRLRFTYLRLLLWSPFRIVRPPFTWRFDVSVARLWLLPLLLVFVSPPWVWLLLLKPAPALTWVSLCCYTVESLLSPAGAFYYGKIIKIRNLLIEYTKDILTVADAEGDMAAMLSRS